MHSACAAGGLACLAHLAYLDDPPAIIHGAADMDDDINRPTDLIVDRRKRPAGYLLQHERAQPGNGVDRRVGVDVAIEPS